MIDDDPLILTLRFDAPHQARFDALRQAHFPPERNYLNAHVTLFHKLPGIEIGAVRADLARVVAETAPAEVEVDEPIFLGRGVAFRLVSADVDALRRRLAARWDAWLSGQDRAKGALHVTVQNKVRPAEGRILYAALLAGFSPSRFTSPGVDLWRYRGGPWDHAGRFEFAR